MTYALCHNQNMRRFYKAAYKLGNRSAEIAPRSGVLSYLFLHEQSGVVPISYEGFIRLHPGSRDEPKIYAEVVVLGLVSGGDGGMQFLRPMDGNTMAAATAFQQQQQVAAAAAAAASNMQQVTPAYITLPITMPGAKPGDAQQTVQIQVLNPNPVQPPTQQAPKLQMSQMQIPIQGFQQGTTVLTVAYGPQDDEIMHNHGLPEGMTIVAALQPQDLQLLAQAQNASLMQQQQQHQQHQHQLSNHDAPMHPAIKVENDQPPPMRPIKQEAVWNNIPNLTAAPAFGADIAEFLQQRGQAFNLQPFLKFNNNNDSTLPLAPGDHLIGGSIPNNNAGNAYIKREIIDENSNDNTQYGADSSQADSSFKENSSISGDTSSSTFQESPNANIGACTSTTSPPGEDGTPPVTKARKKRKYKSKPPKPKRQKPGQVLITTAIDGTVLFCCPECQMAYPEKECLEQHLAVHKIERRFICDICGAGLKRKEHLERHKLGHNPERPYICSVCMKGFKRKEHLNLHFVIHSGVKTEICGDCGKGFYRKDHLRKHIKSHMTKRLKEEKASNGTAPAGRSNGSNTNNSSSNSGNNNSAIDSSSNAVSTTTATSSSDHPPISLSLPPGIPPGLTITASSNSLHNHSNNHSHTPSHPPPLAQGICLPQGVTIHVPTADNQTLPVQISLPQLVAQQQTASDGSTSTVLVPASEALQQQQQQH
ncbi:specificity protein transcription factor 3-like [Uranotaenia lowii]|uniref:specificity protein transcription factor 3-like n=1 Tax=Uranotaenia lowii TaxID=190385 RepID=UPI002478CC3D|nr:specificity protein transcription factor 3-like [Uranotaenia lowii]